MNEENETCCARAPKLERFKPRYTSEYSDEAWLVKVALPGVVREDLHISIENEIMEVRAIRKAAAPEGWRRLTGSGADREYRLRLDVGPEVDGTIIEATLVSGEVTIRLPLKDQAKPRTIPVT